MLYDDPSLIPLGENGLLHNSYPTNSYVKGMARAEMVYKKVVLGLSSSFWNV